jgi:activator of HSP90 ATPase
MFSHLTRRDFSVRLAAFLGLGSVAAAGEDVSRTSESIHQEVVLKASRKRVYDALTDAKTFTLVTSFSTVKNAPPAQISRDVGGAFSLFGGHIIGRHLELVVDQRIVQAWRVVDWDQGLYSIARFELKDQGPRTTLVLDHTGFPSGGGQHLAEGWNANYWEPLGKYLSQST